MGQRNMLCTNQMLDLEMDQQGQEHLPPDPCILLGNITNFSHTNLHPGASASGNTSNHSFHHAAGHPDSSLFFGSQYNSFQHPITNIDFGVAATPSFYNPYMIPPPASRLYPVSLNHGSSNHLASSSNPGLGFDADNYERNHFMDFISRSQGKRKIVDGVSGSYPHLNDPASSSSSSATTQLNTMPHQWEEQYEPATAMSESAARVPAEPRSSGILTVAEGLAERSVRSRSSTTVGLQLEPSLAHNQNNLLDGTYMRQSFQPESSSAWVEQQFGSNCNDGVPSTWSHALPYIQGRSVNGGPVEISNMGGQGYQDTTSSRNSAIVFHTPSMHHHYHHQFHHHQPLPPVQPMRGHNYNYHNQLQLSPYRHPANYILHPTSANPSRDAMETVPRHPRPFPSNGLRIYRPHRSGGHQSSENRNNPHLRLLSTDEVAILEIPGFYEVGSFGDQHRDMRLDIDDMSYEELLALGERIGSVKTGLSEETILRQLKTRRHASAGTCLPMDESDEMEREPVSCIICQVEYRNHEKVGTLDCGHEYHADCIKQWLLVKNVCPICKVPAMTTAGKESQ